jgi:succinoglycan biosynthesis protein ExoA
MVNTSLQQGTGEQTAASAAPAVLPSISVIIPVRNEAAYLRRTLEQILKQDYPGDFEVVVVDGQSTDGTRDIVRELQAIHVNLRLYENPARLSSAARNIGVRHASGAIVLIIDGHCDVESPQHLREIAAAFSRSGADCLGRPQPLEVAEASPLQRAIALARRSWLGHHPASFIYSRSERFVPPQSVAVAYRRSIFEQVGLFDENFDACEDVELNHRIDQAGLRCFFTPRIGVRYHPRSNLAGLFKQMVRYGRGRVRLFRKHPETFSLGTWIPAAFVLGLAGGPALFWLPGWFGGIYWGALAAYAVLVAAASLWIAARPGRLQSLCWLPPVFVTIHVASGVGVLRELFRSRAFSTQRKGKACK